MLTADCRIEMAYIDPETYTSIVNHDMRKRILTRLYRSTRDAPISKQDLADSLGLDYHQLVYQLNHHLRDFWRVKEEQKVRGTRMELIEASYPYAVFITIGKEGADGQPEERALPAYGPGAPGRHKGHTGRSALRHRHTMSDLRVPAPHRPHRGTVILESQETYKPGRALTGACSPERRPPPDSWCWADTSARARPLWPPRSERSSGPSTASPWPSSPTIRATCSWTRST